MRKCLLCGRQASDGGNTCPFYHNFSILLAVHTRLTLIRESLRHQRLWMLIRRVFTKITYGCTVMKKFICIFFSLTIFTGCQSNRLYREMTDLLNASDYFNLETALKNNGAQLTETKKLYFKAHLESAFNQTEKSLQAIDLLFSKHKKSLNDAQIISLLRIKYNNHLRQFKYEQAAETLYELSPLIELYGSPLVREELKGLQQLYNSLRNVPPQKIIHVADAIIPIKKTELRHLTMQVVCNGVTEEFVFDTGFTNSTITESVAQRMDIQPLDGFSRISTSAGNLVEAKVGIADSLRINDLVFENVVFNILPDEQLTWPEKKYGIRGIIGFNLMNQMKEIRIDHLAGNIIVPQTPVKRDLRNLFWDGSYSIVRLESGQDTLLFVLDTGATQSSFFKKYFDAHRDRIVKKSQHAITTIQGMGKGVLTEIYVLTDVPFKIDNFQMTLPKINVITQKYSYAQDYNGNLGQDVLMHFDEMILNFESMYLTFNDKNK